MTGPLPEPSVEADPDEALFERLRSWLHEARAAAARLNGAPLESPFQPLEADAPREFGLLRLAEEFTALRQEVKLQSRAARGLEELVQNLAEGLRTAVEAARSIEPREAQAAIATARPLALALVELDEALDRGRRQFERICQRLAADPATSTAAALEGLFQQQPWWRRPFVRGYHAAVRERLTSETPGDRQRSIEVLLDGFRLIQDRLARVLASERIERLPVVGQPVDAECMVVVDLVDVADSPPGVVVDEVRPGYLWDGRVLRCAEVRAARRPSSQN